MIELVTPAVRYQASYLAALDEFGGAHRDGDGLLVEEADETFPGWSIDLAELETAPGFQRLVDWRVDAATPEHPRREGHVPCTFLWIAEDGNYLGSLAIRHELTPFLLSEGGHIGYSVRPSVRRRGIATAALAAALPRCAAMGIDPVLVTCDEGNVGSRRVIEANGGVYEDSRNGTRRYWIDTAP